MAANARCIHTKNQKQRHARCLPVASLPARSVAPFLSFSPFWGGGGEVLPVYPTRVSNISQCASSSGALRIKLS